MQIAVYDAEKHEKGVWWYILFALVFVSVVVLSLLYRNVVWVIVLFFLLGWYFYFSVRNNQIVMMRITDNALAVWDKLLPWNVLQGYVLEIDKKTEEVRNIVLVYTDDYAIHTIATQDSQEFKSFIQSLDGYIPLLSGYHQTALQILSRKLKL